MSSLKLNFLDDGYSKNEVTYVDILNKYGTEIVEYAHGYFEHAVTSTSIEEDVKDITLYILAPELPFEYRLMNVEILNINTVKLSVFSLIKSAITINLDVTDGISVVETKVKEYLGSTFTQESLRLLATKVNLKRKSTFENP